MTRPVVDSVAPLSACLLALALSEAPRAAEIGAEGGGGGGGEVGLGDAAEPETASRASRAPVDGPDGRSAGPLVDRSNVLEVPRGDQT